MTAISRAPSGNGFGLGLRQRRAAGRAPCARARRAKARRAVPVSRPSADSASSARMTRSRLQRLFAGHELGDGIAEPANRAVVGEHERVVDRLGEASGARREFLGQLEFARFVVKPIRLGLLVAIGSTWKPRSSLGPRPARAARRRAYRHPASLLPPSSRFLQLVVFDRPPTVGAVAIHWAAQVRRGSLPDRLGAANGGGARAWPRTRPDGPSEPSTSGESLARSAGTVAPNAAPRSSAGETPGPSPKIPAYAKRDFRVKGVNPRFRRYSFPGDSKPRHVPKLHFRGRPHGVVAADGIRARSHDRGDPGRGAPGRRIFCRPSPAEPIPRHLRRGRVQFGVRADLSRVLVAQGDERARNFFEPDFHALLISQLALLALAYCTRAIRRDDRAGLRKGSAEVRLRRAA